MSADDAARAAAEVVAAVRGGGALLALDFDGCLAPLQDDPELSRALPEAVTALDRLAGVRGLHLAIVSGRAIGDLSDKAEVPQGTHLVGSHGGERGRRQDGGVALDPFTLDPERARALADLAAALDDAVAPVPGARVERKPASVVLHTRTVADAAAAARLTEHALALGAGDDVDAMRGKDVVELSVLEVTKGDALAALRADLGVDVVAYAGDDVTDERAFATLGPGDVTVKVGEGASAARFRVADPDAMARLLTQVADDLT
ncbi:haloacid dehalogenase [Actinotalea ferrariae CF5-4]|uniref:Trehalose 6-phosphate phosphatase n=1 Tax=Actinotalea ferrariae CF5-4 TaxID=948458 RepID=A0A021VUU3_9CELL|nr:trehalose-phosphatase [Actinotalea ferrariae]EYR63830.1 haloacid dehalogenase [Actinotalea ferrariae CF5-4]